MGSSRPSQLTQPGFLPGVSEGEGGRALLTATSSASAGQTLGAQKRPRVESSAAVMRTLSEVRARIVWILKLFSERQH